MNPIIFHIDVNSAFLSWTALSLLQRGETEDLRLIPSVIGGDSQKRHGVVLAKSGPAKAYGIKTGEPLVNALRKCPFLVLAPPDHTMYRECSHLLMDYLSSFCPVLQQVSIDECYMDYAPISHLYSSPMEAALSLKNSIKEKLGFTVNIGISDRKVLAKMASDFQKPDQIHTLFFQEIQEKLWPLAVERLYMCGRSSAETLKKLGIITIGDLAHCDPSILELHLKSHGITLWEFANGQDCSSVDPSPVTAKGIGNSITLSEDITTADQAHPILLSLAEKVSKRLCGNEQYASMVSCEIKYSSFQSVSHQTTLTSPTDSSTILYETACQLFHQLWNNEPIRLLGIRTSKLTNKSEPRQMSLFDSSFLFKETGSPSPEKIKKLDLALDSIKNKYGNDAVIRASLLSKDH